MRFPLLCLGLTLTLAGVGRAQQPAARPATAVSASKSAPVSTAKTVAPGAVAKPTAVPAKTVAAPAKTAAKPTVSAGTSAATATKPASTAATGTAAKTTSATNSAVPAKPATAVSAAPRPAAKPAPALPAGIGSSDPETRYQNGKILIQQGRYTLAMDELLPLTPPAAKFGRAPEAAYLYAVAATRAKKWAEAEQMLNLLRNEYSQWPGMADVYFLQGQVSFEQGEPDNALKVLEQIPAGQLRAERMAMKTTYLSRIQDKSLWQNLLRRHQQDTTLARAYAEQLVNGGLYTDADRPQLDQLVRQFGLDRARYTPRPRPTKKASYNVAVLLPFEFNDPSWETRRRLQFVTDLYAGMKLAQDSLQREGHPVQLYAYDTGADTTQLKQLLQLPELASMDMIIGPVYKTGSKILARYAREKQIVVVNPLSQDGELVQDNPWHYLFGASTATQGRLAAEFAYRSFGGSPAVVLHENNKDEAAFGQAYKATYERLGGRVLALRPVDSDAPDALTAAFTGFDAKSASHVVVASDVRKAGPATLSAMQAQGLRVPIITYSSWLDNPSLSPSQLDQREVYFLYPKYIDYTLPAVRHFRQVYTLQQQIPPSVFAFSGFEMLYYFGNQLHQYGPAFQPQLAASGPVSGVLFQGIGYPNQAHDNQYVPITKLNRMELEVENPVGMR